MSELNFHHLRYFWATARTGSIARASRELGLTSPTLSGQIRSLEQGLGVRLFRRAGRGLALTEEGHTVQRYADEIFGLGRELTAALSGAREAGTPLRLEVGLSNAIPKLAAHRLLRPALEIDRPVRLVCREDRLSRLVAELALHRLDLVLSDAPLGADVRVKAFSHLLGECEVVCFAAPRLAERLRRRFPGSLDGAPFLFPLQGSALRQSLDSWFEAHHIRPEIVAEIEDSALVKVFGQEGAGAFAVPAMIAGTVMRQYGVRRVGTLTGVRERFYAISVERRLKHPAVVALTAAARLELAR